MFSHIALSLVASLGILAATAHAVDAQTTPAPGATQAQSATPQKPRWEVLIPSGTAVPTVTKGNTIKRGNLTAVQLSYVVRPNLAITSTLGWIRSRDIASAGSPKLDIFTYDLGAEVRAPRLTARKRLTFSPFAGAGAGGRSYNYRSLEVNATHNLGAYVSAGGALGLGRVGLRLEVREYVTGFKPLGGQGSTRARNDVVVMVGLRVTMP